MAPLGTGLAGVVRGLASRAKGLSLLVGRETGKCVFSSSSLEEVTAALRTVAGAVEALEASMRRLRSLPL
jgi:hypothetical protein